MEHTLVNVTRHTVVATDVEQARGFLARARGLLGRRVFDPGAALVLAPCTSVHSLGMRFAIDVLFLSSDGTVLKSLALPPWRMSPFVWRARSTIELPAGTIAHTRTQDGDIIRLVPASRHTASRCTRRCTELPTY